MRVIFLDIDGVLNSVRSCVAYGGYPMELEHRAAFDDISIKLLQRLCDSSGVQIVLSSAWRKFYRHEAVGEMLGLPIIDRTIDLNGAARGLEINEWLSRHPNLVKYAIIDDDGDMLPEQREFFVQTDCDNGLMWGDYVKLCRILGEEPFAGGPRSREWAKAGMGGW